MARPPDIRIRGIRGPIPSGYVLGRTEAGHGDVHLIPIGKDGKIGSGAGAGGGGGGGGGAAGFQNQVFFQFLGFSAPGFFAPRQQFAMAIAPRAVLFPSFSQASRSAASCEFAPTSNTSFVLTNNLAAYLASGANVMCTVSFAAGAHTGTFAWGTPVTISALTVLYIVMNAVADPSFANIQAIFCGDPA